MMAEAGNHSLKDFLRGIIQLVFRSFPFPVEPGLYRFGNPDRKSLVFLTCNFEHTVRVVGRILANYDCYLLVAPTQGVNVWCASAGGHFTAKEVEAAIKLSGIDGLVDHRRLILPRLAAPGVDVNEVRQRAGWRVVFGPIEIEDLPAWLERRPLRLIRDQVSFPTPRRLEMGLGAGLWPAAIFGVPVALISGWKMGILAVIASYLFSVLFALVYPRLPLEPGIPQALGFGGALASVGLTALLAGGLEVWTVGIWTATLFALGGLIALDFPSWSPTDVCKQQLICFLYPSTLAPPGFLPTIDEEKCVGCDICVKVCPKGALELTEQKKAVLTDEQACMSCYSCVQQCPVDAIS